ncbi:hypothetical protein SteCoe_27671 [Stentor coeruleus]|uniref:Uncharacterized protein n=1 Tax=Stentor coeruleus TaxID=5963 RepID=A0A1R2BA08_9CILI|nr:hypothetical protein SteCoe_27671 [Stentor coeruleus]
MIGERVVLTSEYQRILEKNGLALAKDFGIFDTINLTIIGYLEKIFAYRDKYKLLGPQFIYSFISNVSCRLPRPLSYLLNLFTEINSTIPFKPETFQKYISNSQFLNEISALSYFIPSREYLSDILNVEICIISKEHGSEIINCSNLCSQIRISLLNYNQKYLICYTKKDEPIFPNIVSNDFQDLKAEYLQNLISNLKKLGSKYNIIKSEEEYQESQNEPEKQYELEKNYEKENEIAKQDEIKKKDDRKIEEEKIEEEKIEEEKIEEEKKKEFIGKNDKNKQKAIEEKQKNQILNEERYEINGIPIQLFKVLYKKDNKPVKISFLDIKSIEKLVESGQAYLSYTFDSILPIPDLTLTQQTIKHPISQDENDEENIIPTIEKIKSVYEENDLLSSMKFN